MRGRYYAANDYTEDGYRKAVLYLRTAIDEDSAYALADTGLADSYYDTSNLIFPANEAMPRAKTAAQRAVELAPSVAAAHVSLGLIASKFDWNWDVAGRNSKRRSRSTPTLRPLICGWAFIVRNWATSIARSQNFAGHRSSIRSPEKSMRISASFCIGQDAMTTRSFNFVK